MARGSWWRRILDRPVFRLSWAGNKHSAKEAGKGCEWRICCYGDGSIIAVLRGDHENKFYAWSCGSQCPSVLFDEIRACLDRHQRQTGGRVDSGDKSGLQQPDLATPDYQWGEGGTTDREVYRGDGRSFF